MRAARASSASWLNSPLERFWRLTENMSKGSKDSASEIQNSVNLFHKLSNIFTRILFVVRFQDREWHRLLCNYLLRKGYVIQVGSGGNRISSYDVIWRSRTYFYSNSQAQTNKNTILLPCGQQGWSRKQRSLVNKTKRFFAVPWEFPSWTSFLLSQFRFFTHNHSRVMGKQTFPFVCL